MIRETSLEAYRALDLVKSEADLMRLVQRHYPSGRFTRKELSARTGWEINRICGRVNALVTKGYLTEYPQTRDGGHLLSVKPREKGHGSAPLSVSHNSGGGAVTSTAGPYDQPAAPESSGATPPAPPAERHPAAADLLPGETLEYVGGEYWIADMHGIEHATGVQACRLKRRVA